MECFHIRKFLRRFQEYNFLPFRFQAYFHSQVSLFHLPACYFHHQDFLFQDLFQVEKESQESLFQEFH
jgi:hypothetical protein